ncbi:MAG: hypothetical protein AAF629_02950 [Chloroflexota bacterium]
MTTMVRTSHRFYKRYQSSVESVITGLGLGLLVGLLLANIPVYPPNWAPVLISIIALVAIQWPLVAYLLAALVIIYPIYTISLYLAVLFFAIAILAHRPASHYLGATVLIFLTPLLAQYQLHWAVPILAGLWWGSVNGFWVGGAAALWGKMLAGMSGLEIDWLLITGQTASLAGIMQRFNGVGSLDTLSKLIAPIAPDTTLLLYHLLQIAVWALVAGFVGFLAHQRWIYHRYPWSTLLISAAGITALGLSHLFLTIWLKKTDPTLLNYDPLLIVAVAGLVVSSTLAVVRQALELPVAPKVHRRIISVPVKRNKSNQPKVAETPSLARPTPVPMPELPEWQPPEDDTNDLILLELD